MKKETIHFDKLHHVFKLRNLVLMDEFYRITANNRRMNLVFGLAEHLHYADRSSNPEIPEWNRLPQKGGLESQERYVGEAEACILRMENERGYNPSL